MVPQSLSCAILLLLALAPSLGQGPADGAEAVLKSAREASGARALNDIPLIRAVGPEWYAGLEGRWSTTQSLRDGRFSSTSDFKVYQTTDVFDGSVRWRQDRSGGVHPLNAPFTQRKTRTDAWLARRGYLLPDAGGAALSAPSDRAVSGRHFFAITVTPPDAEPIDLWFDAETHLLMRAVRQMPTFVEVTRFEDYRSFKGAQLPYRIIVAQDDGTNEDRMQVDGYEAAAVRDDLFQKPVPPRDTELGASSVTPAEPNRGFVISARLNDQGPFQFILDTGGHNILTPAALHTLGLQASGHAKSGGAGEGSVDEQVTRVDKLQLGSATMRDQFFAVLPLDYATTERDPGPPLAGIIGLEVFERAIVRLDYRHATLTLLPLEQRPDCSGTVVPLIWDDDLPLVTGAIDGLAGLLAVDTGNSGSTVVQGIWAGTNGVASQLKKGLETVSFGVGGASRNWLSFGHRVALGSAEIADAELRYAEDRKGAFSSRTEAGNVGYNVLGHFTVTFDYARSQMCLERVPGFEPPPTDRSGLRVVKTERNSFTVVQVAAHSPAASAGFREGDLIVAINDRAAATLSYDDVFRLFRGLPGTRLTLDVIRASERMRLVVALRILSLPQ